MILWHAQQPISNIPAGAIQAHPGAVTQGGYDRDAVIRVTLDGGFDQVRVQGQGAKTNGSMRFYIYKGEDGYDAPLWEAWEGGAFDLTIPYSDGDYLYFAVDAGPNDINDWSYWEDIRFQGLGQGEPPPILPPPPPPPDPSAGLIQNAEMYLADFFPMTTNGENGIHLQYSEANGSYGDLTNAGDYDFWTADAPWNVPRVTLLQAQQPISDIPAGAIQAHPSTQLGMRRDAVIRVTLDGGYDQVRVQGVGAKKGGSMRFYIYKGEDGYSDPLWEAWEGGQFDLTIPYTDGEYLHFAVDPGSSDSNDWSYWEDIRFNGEYQGDPPPVLPPPPPPPPPPDPSAGLIQDAETFLADFYPMTTNGENGIRLQYSEANGSHGDLTNAGDYDFWTAESPWKVPRVILWHEQQPVSNIPAGAIQAHPSAVTQGGNDRDAVIRVTLDGGFDEVRVQGQGAKTNGSMRFYIYKGQNGYSAPLWEAWEGGAFDLTIPYTDGEYLFFAVDAGADDVNDWSYWEDIRFQGLGQGEPPPVLPPPPPPAAADIETPTKVVFEEIGETEVTASAYAPNPAFTGLGTDQAAVNLLISPDGAGFTEDGWHGSADSWATRAPIPTPRQYGLVAAFGGKLYVIGGVDGSGSCTDKNEAYDPVTDTWQTMAPMPTAREFIGGSVIGGKIYAVGGRCYPSSPVGVNEAYDPVSDTWQAMAPMPTARLVTMAAASGGKLYVMGGYTGSTTVTANEEYDPATDSWSTRSPMPAARNDARAESLTGKIYVIGGYTPSPFAIVGTNAEYDPATDSWTSRAAMPTARRGISLAVLGDKIYAMGGFSDAEMYAENANEVYDPATDTWVARADVPNSHAWGGGGALGGRLHVMGGYDGNTRHALHDEYDPGLSTKFPGLAAGGLYFFKAKARDAGGVETPESPVFEVQLKGGPVVAPIPPQSVDEGNTPAVQLSATDPESDPLGLSASAPSFCALTDNGNGTGALSCGPGFSDAGTYSVTITATDPGMDSGSETFVLTVNEICDVAEEVCDGADNDCDGQIDEGVSSAFYQDADSDAYGDAASPAQACDAPPGYVADATDCDDADGAVNPAATEICDGKDNDCDGGADEHAELGSTTCGVGVCQVTVDNCVDGTPTTCAPFWGAQTEETCDGLDNDCDGQVDEGLLSTFYRDADGDGYGNAASTAQACDAPPDYVADASDCDDSNKDTNPGATEVCDGADNDCDGAADEDLTRPTACGEGACASTGEETCSNGSWGGDTCTPLVTPYRGLTINSDTKLCPGTYSLG
ncbi:MAG: MopE-related protein, partial [Elusimicrobiota bacterium]